MLLVLTIKRKDGNVDFVNDNEKKQECIPVGCVPTAAVTANRYQYPWGLCPGGLCMRGSLSRGGSLSGEREGVSVSLPLSPMNRITCAIENITFVVAGDKLTKVTLSEIRSVDVWGFYPVLSLPS